MRDGEILCATIGLGACGSAIAESAKLNNLGHAFFIANTSTEDLNAITRIDDGDRYKIKAPGTGKNRIAAFDTYRSEYDAFVSMLKRSLQEKAPLDKYDIIFVAASGGGGTGSGLLPVVSRILRGNFPNVYIIPIVVFPSSYERGIAQQNAIDCLRELENLNDEGFGIIIVNNDKGSCTRIEERYKEINDSIVNNIKDFLTFNKHSKISNIDIADRKSMFSDTGAIIIASAELEPLKSGGDMQSPILYGIKKAVEDSPMVINADRFVKRVAIQCECSDEYYERQYIIDAQEYFKNVEGVFEGYYGPRVISYKDKDGSRAVNRITIALSGAKLSSEFIRDRSTMVESLKISEDNPIIVDKGNKELKNSWIGANNANKVEANESSIAAIFDLIDQKRKE